MLVGKHVRVTVNRQIAENNDLSTNITSYKEQLPFNNLPCSYGENVPASKLIYGSILIAVTSIPQHFNIAPNELAITPLPTPLITPPVINIYFLLDILMLI